MFFVGLGGSGGKTLRFLKRDLNLWLESIGWEDGIPSGWQFLQIDTPTVADGAEIRSAPMLPDDEYLGLVANGTTFDDIDSALMNAKKSRAEFASWRVKPQGLGVPVHTGAGMYRAVGRTVALAYLPQIRERLNKSFARLNQPDAQASLSTLYRHVHGEDPASAQSAPIVVVASSLAGGTGAGLINDVCDLLREIDPVAGDASFGLLYTPEVFESIAPNARGGIQPNSLAAICEVLNGYWWNGGSGSGLSAIPRKNSPLMLAAQAVTPYNRTGPAFPFLVGAQNSAGIKYKSDRQLFEVVGAALTSWATDITVQNQLLAYTYANWKSRADDAAVKNMNVLVNQGSAALNESGLNPFSALGFARVSVGNRYFARYSAERLARDAIDFLRRNHEVGGFAQSIRKQQPNVTADELIARQCAEQFNWFINLCRLDEKGPSSNQVQDSLSPPQHEWERIFGECLTQALDWCHQDGNHTAVEWMQTIQPAVENAAISFDERCQPIIEERVLAWIKEHPKVITNAVTQAAGTYGIRIAEALVAKLIYEISDPIEGIISDLQNEINEYSRWALKSEWSGRASAAFTQPARKIPKGPVIEQACNEALTNAICTTWARVKILAIELLNQFTSGFLEPLRQALATASFTLDSVGPDVDAWPTWPRPGQLGSLSPSSTPPMSERTLIKPDDFSSLFDDLLAQAVGGAVNEFETHRVVARLQTICGEFLEGMISANQSHRGDLESLRFLNHDNEWWPGVSVVRNSHKPPTIASFSLGVDADSIKGRAEKWLRQPGNPFSRVLSDSLRSFTANVNGHNAPGVTDLDYRERQSAFLEAFESATNASKPLVGLDTQLMASLFNNNSYPHLALEVSSVPFEDHPLYSSVVDRLNAEFSKLPTPKDATDYFNRDAASNHIDIVTSLYGAYPVLVIESLLKPIAQAWNSLTDNNAREAFWDKRRARRLTEFIPAPQQHVLCMLRGWFVGRALGLVYRDEKSSPWSVVPRHSELGTRVKALPAIPLSRSSAWGDAPALVMESLGLAYVEVGVRNNVEPLDGYVNLLELGKEGDGSTATLGVYGTVGDFVSTWIRAGEVRIAKGVSPRSPKPKLAQAATPEDRYEALVQHFSNLRSKYAKAFAMYESDFEQSPDILGTTPLWPSMHDLISAALGQLLSALENLRRQSGQNTEMYLDDDDD